MSGPTVNNLYPALHNTFEGQGLWDESFDTQMLQDRNIFFINC